MIDFNIEHGYPTLNNDVDLILQQIEILFDTTPGEVLGSVDFGTRYSDFLYNLQLSNEDIKNIISRDLQSLELFGFTYKIDVDIFIGSENDIVLVKIEFDRDDYKFDKTIKITR
jgi:hypothetical protein